MSLTLKQLQDAGLGNDLSQAVVDALAEVQPKAAPKPKKAPPSNDDQMLAILARLEAVEAESEAAKAENAKLKEKLAEKVTTGEKPIYFKVSQKGGVSAYDLQRLPVSLYANQWERLLDKADELKAFIKANESSLSRK